MFRKRRGEPIRRVMKEKGEKGGGDLPISEYRRGGRGQEEGKKKEEKAAWEKKRGMSIASTCGKKGKKKKGKPTKGGRRRKGEIYTYGEKFGKK